MKIAPTKLEIDASAVILWQYDNAQNLLALIKSLDGVADGIVSGIYKWLRDYFYDINAAGGNDDPLLYTEGDGVRNGVGLDLWGLLIGVPHPSVTINGASRRISNDFYRRLLIARARLNRSIGSMADYNKYIYDVFGGKVTIDDGMDMSMTYYVGEGLSDEESALVGQFPDSVFLYPMGVKTNTEAPVADVIGFNDTETQGQNKANLSKTQTSNVDGGTFAS